ncbi:MAG: VWA domain-containing protein [Acidobacteriota bacterium]
MPVDSTFLPLSALLRRGLLMVLLSALAIPLASTAQAPDEAAAPVETPPLGERVDVNVVNIDVYVRDRDGQPITGLEADDFVLEVDDREVPISNFYSVEDGRAVVPGAVAIAAQPVVGEQVERPVTTTAPETPEDQQSHLVVYVDNFNLKPFNRNRVLRAARGFLREDVVPGTRVMLVSYERSLKVREPFTEDVSKVSSALYDLEDLTGFRVRADSERREILSTVFEEELDSQFYVSGRVGQYAESIYNDMVFTLDALTELVTSFAGLPGRKAILYVSEGLPLRPAEDIFHAISDRFRDSSVLLETHRYDLTRRYDSLVALANAHRVTFYTVDAEGLRTYSSMEAATASYYAGASRIDSQYISNQQMPLRLLAGQTGGIAILNTNGFDEPLDRMAADLGTYYSLGFISSAQEVGRYREVKVRLRNKQRGVDLRYRDGYRDRSIAQRMRDGAVAALQYGLEKNPLEVTLAGGEATPHEGQNQFLMPLVVRIPIGGLTFLPTGDVHRGRVRLYVAAQDLEGGLAEVQEVPVPIDIPTAEIDIARTKLYEYRLTLLMRGGRQTVAVGVRDEIGAAASFVTASTRVGV